LETNPGDQASSSQALMSALIKEQLIKIR
jgi:hypothetical protein